MADTQVTFDILARDRASRPLRNIGTQADRTSDRFRRFGKVSARTAKVAGAAFGGALVGIAVGLGKAAKAAAAEEQEMAVLHNTLRRATGATDAQIASTEKWVTATQNATGVVDGDLRPALGKLAIATGDIGKAQKLLAIGLDISAARGKSLSTVVEALGKGALGTTGGLARLGLATKDAGGKALAFDDILKSASKTMGGAAAAANTAAGRYAILKARFADLVEEVGYKVLPVLNKLLAFVSDSLIPALGKLAAWFREHVMPALRQAGEYVRSKLIPTMQDMGYRVLPLVTSAGRDLVHALVDLRKAFGFSTDSAKNSEGALTTVKVLMIALAAAVKVTALNFRTFAWTVKLALAPFRALLKALIYAADVVIPKFQAAWKALTDLPSFRIKVPGLPDLPHPHLPGLATGGTATRSGLAMVGERGAEVVKLNRGDTVYPTGTGPGGGGITIENLNVTSGPGERAEYSVPRALRRVVWAF